MCRLVQAVWESGRLARGDWSKWAGKRGEGNSRAGSGASYRPGVVCRNRHSSRPTSRAATSTPNASRYQVIR